MTAPLFREQALRAQRHRQFGVPLRLSMPWPGVAGWVVQGLRDAFRRQTTPLVLQAEAAECGLACLAMVAGHHGHDIDLATLRARHPLSSRGATLADLMNVAGRLHLGARPLRLEPEQLGELPLPCVLHWGFNHFVVLTHSRGGRVVLHDPACGRREMALHELGEHFTGIALELAPAPDFQPRRDRQRLPVAALVGRLPGLARRAGQALMLTLLLQSLMLLSPIYLQSVVDQALTTQDRPLVATLGLAFLLLAALQAAVTALRGWLLAVIGASLNLQLQRRLLHHLLRLPMGWFQRRQTGDVLSRFDSLQAMQRTMSTGLLEALVDGAMALLTLVMMFSYSARLALVGVGAALVYGAMRLGLYRTMRRAAEEQMTRAALQHGHLLETLRGMQTIKLLAHEGQRFARWNNLAVDQSNATLQVERLSVLAQALNGGLFAIENVLTIWLGALLVLAAPRGAGLTIGMLVAFLAYKTQFAQRAAALVDKALELRLLGLHAERVSDIVLAAPEEPGGTAPTTEVGASLALKALSFGYEGEPPLFEGLDLRIEAGESVAIVGPSGCGKTTLVKLMLGLLQPTAGHIEAGGVPLDQLGLARYRGAVAGVMQDDVLFAGSIADNICFFDPQPDPDRIEACARQAAVHDDIAAMPMRYETLVGDMGTVLSGGQKQRVLLARALYRQPRILFLDEATSHLDVAGEHRVNEAVRALNLTRIIVAHRPETVASADRVIDLGAATRR
ncbi:peptidase domain-containing ABC transporter [Ideonella sp.]|uniref:peptidase domain-containing ABC transporter n=1 Tax=Ideonella sp. TaxID=1929293 RepID=UPI002B467B0D|nr:peptidase domain-containing ABC transporter [Ideonella sp.]HJV69942.1 peptidase domain-containing ABC transporter [Ideonella sp.]